MAGVFVIALGLRLWGINFGLPALYRPDEDVAVGRAMGILHGILNPHFADWPHLYFYVATAWLAPLQNEWIQIRSRGVNGRGQTRATTANNDHFLHISI